MCKIFICFIIFAFLGWYLEVLYGLCVTKKIVNRGFLIGPLCPIYGIGCVLIYLLLGRYKNDPIILIIAGMVLCSVLEYIVSLLLEKIFKVRWWDYHQMKFNINGRICLEMAIPFGVLGLFVVEFLFPQTLKFINLFNENIIVLVSIIMFIMLFIDILFSFSIISKFRSITKLDEIKDSTEEISNFVRETLYKQSAMVRRLINSFPDFIPIPNKKKFKIRPDK